MIWFSRLGPVLSAVITILVLSGCVATPSQAPAPTSGTASVGCSIVGPYTHKNDTDDADVAVPQPPVSGETIENVLMPGNKLVGCENPKYRLVRGSDQDAWNLFVRLTKNAPDGQKLPTSQTLGIYEVFNFMSDVKILPNNTVVGYRGRVDCRGPIIWIFQWSGEGKGKEKHNPVELQYVDPNNPCGGSGQMHSLDADGGGP